MIRALLSSVATASFANSLTSEMLRISTLPLLSSYAGREERADRLRGILDDVGFEAEVFGLQRGTKGHHVVGQAGHVHLDVLVDPFQPRLERVLCRSLFLPWAHF